jgi:serine/threonine protein phosphatase PrpC
MTYSFSGIGSRIDMQDMGLFRKIPDKPIAWCIVCDGMGGQLTNSSNLGKTISEIDDYLKTNANDNYLGWVVEI